MSVGSLPALPPPIVPLPPVLRGGDAPVIRRWTVDEYHQMILAGILKESEPVELLEGWVVYKVPRGADQPALRPWTVDEYHQMIRAGILKESEPVELLEGCVVQKMSRNTPHDVALDKTEDAIRAVLPAGWRLRSQKAISTDESEPEPDCAIVAGNPDTYLTAHPGPADIAFLVEVSDTSLTLDRTSKARLYGRAGVPVYWVVNVPDRQVEVYTDPTGVTDPPDAAGYGTRQDYPDTASVPVVIRGQVVAQLPVAGLLPRV